MAPRPGNFAGAVSLPVRRLHVELTNHCNFRCEFCADRAMSRPRGTMPLAMVDEILSQAGQDRIAQQAHFHVMGEPALFPNLAEAVRLAKRYGMEAWVTTNGSILTRELLGRLLSAGLSHLTLSLQTPDARTFAFRNAGPLSYETYERRVVETVQAFLDADGEAGITVCFFSNPLRRFFAPDPPSVEMAATGKELRAHLDAWAEKVLRGTPLESEIPRILGRIKKAGLLKENTLPIADRIRFRVRALGNWAGHFALPIRPARFGYCPGIVENFGILWNGDYVFCCTDYDGKTTTANFAETPIKDWLALPEIQRVANGFRRFRVVHPHCALCLGERRRLASLVRQLGSIGYFKLYRRFFENPEGRKAS